jgi:hypothetical protein
MLPLRCTGVPSESSLNEFGAPTSKLKLPAGPASLSNSRNACLHAGSGGGFVNALKIAEEHPSQRECSCDPKVGGRGQFV